MYDFILLAYRKVYREKVMYSLFLLSLVVLALFLLYPLAILFYKSLIHPKTSTFSSYNYLQFFFDKDIFQCFLNARGPAAAVYTGRSTDCVWGFPDKHAVSGNGPFIIGAHLRKSQLPWRNRLDHASRSSSRKTESTYSGPVWIRSQSI